MVAVKPSGPRILGGLLLVLSPYSLLVCSDFIDNGIVVILKEAIGG